MDRPQVQSFEVLTVTSEYSRMGQYQRPTVCFVKAKWDAIVRTVETLFNKETGQKGTNERSSKSLNSINIHSEGKEVSFRDESIKDKVKGLI